MSTQPNVFVDVLCHCTNVAAFEAAGWQRETPEGGKEQWVAGNWDIQGKGTALNTVYKIRATPERITALKKTLSAMAVLTILQEQDPYAPLSIADPEAPTEDELNANDVFYHASKDAGQVAIIRVVHPDKCDVFDINNVKVADCEVGLKFAHSGDMTKDIAGAAETITPGKVIPVSK